MDKSTDKVLEKSERRLWLWGIAAVAPFQIIWFICLGTMEAPDAYTTGLAIIGTISIFWSTFALGYLWLVWMKSPPRLPHPLAVSLATVKIAFDIAVLLVHPQSKYNLGGLIFGLVLALGAMIFYKERHQIPFRTVLLFQAWVIFLILLPIVGPLWLR